MTPYEMVQEFHRVFDCSVDDLSEDTMSARIDLMDEEFYEVMGELFDLDGTLKTNVDREALAKELADLVYVINGSAIAWGIDLDKAVELVHESNMSKLFEDGRPRFRYPDGKVLKPPTYKSPDMSAAVKEL